MKNSHHDQIEGKWEQCLYLFYEKKIKFISCPNFFLLPTHFLTSKIGYGLKLDLMDILVFLCTLKLLYQTHLEGKLSQVYYLSHEKFFFSIYHPKNFFAAHRIFFLLSTIIKSRHRHTHMYTHNRTHGEWRGRLTILT